MFTALSLPLKVWTTVFLPLSEGLVAGAEDTAPALGSSGFESEVGEKTDKHETLAEALRQRPAQGSRVCVGRDWACWRRPSGGEAGAEMAGKAGSRGGRSAWQLGLAPWLLDKLSFCAELGVVGGGEEGGTLPMRRSKRRWQREAAEGEKERGN